MSQRDIPKPGEFYRHFKNKYYQIVATAEHTETGDVLVIYQALYGDYRIYARPLAMFLSPVDREKYPEVMQTFRFEKTVPPFEEKKGTVTEKFITANASRPVQDEHTIIEKVMPEFEKPALEEERYVLDPDVERFLDAGSYKEKQDILMSMRNRVTKKQLHDMAVTMDVTIEDGTEDKMYFSLLNCIRTMARFEINR